MSKFHFLSACVYHLGEDGSLVKHPTVAVVSDSSDHSRIAALTCIDIVIQEMEVKPKAIL